MSESHRQDPHCGERAAVTEGAWNKAQENFNGIVDALGRGPDEGVRDIVVALMAHRFSTSQSCEGHPEGTHGTPYPWVEIYTPEPDEWREMQEVKKEEVERVWKADNALQSARLEHLLDVFYREAETEPDARLCFLPIGIFGGFRVQSRGASALERESSRTRREERCTRYRAELQALALFLRRAPLE